jgi:hypothetical protein
MGKFTGRALPVPLTFSVMFQKTGDTRAIPDCHLFKIARA